MDLIIELFTARYATITSILNQLKMYHFESENEIKVATRIDSLVGRDMHENSVTLEEFLIGLEITMRFDDFVDFDLSPHLIDRWIPKIFSGCTINVKPWQNLMILERIPDAEPCLNRVIESLIEYSKFVSNHAFTPEKRPTEAFVDKWSELISESLKILFLNGKKQLSDIEIDAVKKLEVALMTQDMLSPQYFPLIDTVAFDQEVVKSRKLEILATARDIIESSDTNTCEVNQGTIRGNYFH